MTGSGGNHPGIFIIRKDRDRRRNMNARSGRWSDCALVVSGVAIPSSIVYSESLAVTRRPTVLPCATSNPRLCCSSSPSPAAARRLAGVRCAGGGRWRSCCRRRRWPSGRRRCRKSAEPDLVRHFTNLSTRNMSVDTNFYPLGSCTMKYNPKRHERLAALPGIADLHPLSAGRARCRACCSCSTRCSRSWPRSPGLPAVSLQPAAGAQGELTALLVAAAYFRDHGRAAARKVLIPDSAHGTNPASAAHRRLRRRHGQEQRRAAWSISTTCRPSSTTRPPCS